MVRHDPTQALHVITPTDPQEMQSGLRIILRATEQLERFPQAREGFIRAAQIWENVIASPITVVIDVDFGRTFFGMPYPDPNILGATLSQLLRRDYPRSVAP